MATSRSAKGYGSGLHKYASAIASTVAEVPRLRPSTVTRISANVGRRQSARHAEGVEVGPPVPTTYRIVGVAADVRRSLRREAA
jgi:hypothetical protein